MSSLVLWLSMRCVGLPTVGRQRASNAGRRPAVDNPSAQPVKSKIDRVCCSMPRVPKSTFRSAFSNTDENWRVAASEGGTCTRGLRISVPERSTFAALASSPRVCLHSTTNTQGLPSDRLAILPSQSASKHIPYRQFITEGGLT